MILPICIILNILAGYFLVHLICPEYQSLRKLTLGYLLFGGLFLFIISLLGFSGIIYTRWLVMILLILINIILLALLKFKPPKITGFNIEIGKLLPIAVLVIIPLLVNWYWPVKDWDAIALYDARARFIVFVNGNLAAAFHNLPPYYFSYPLFTSLNHYLVYLFGGTNPMFTYSFIYLSFLISLYFLLSDVIDERLALTCTLFAGLASRIFDHSMIAYTNFPFAVYLILGFIYLYRYLISNKKNDLILFSGLMGISNFVRNEESFWLVTLVIILIVNFGILLRRRKPDWLSIILPTGVFALLIIPWELFKKANGVETQAIDSIVQTSLVTLFSGFRLVYVKDLLIHFWQFALKQDILLITAYILSIIIAIKFQAKQSKSTIGYQVLIIGLIYVFLFVGSLILRLRFLESHWWTLGGSMERLTMFMAPLLIYFTARNIFKEKAKQ